VGLRSRSSGFTCRVSGLTLEVGHVHLGGDAIGPAHGCQQQGAARAQRGDGGQGAAGKRTRAGGCGGAAEHRQRLQEAPREAHRVSVLQGYAHKDSDWNREGLDSDWQYQSPVMWPSVALD
jgi:hypothetical protein